MQKKLVAVAAGALLVLSGCSSTCDNLADASETFEEKFKPCATGTGTTGVFNISQCDANIDKCTDTEKAALDDFADCLSKLSECSPSASNPFVVATTACAVTLEAKVGEACGAAFD